VAEGVEKEVQFEILRARGCDLAQGYWLGHPMHAEQFAQLLVAHQPGSKPEAPG